MAPSISTMSQYPVTFAVNGEVLLQLVHMVAKIMPTGGLYITDAHVCLVCACAYIYIHSHMPA